MEQEQTTAAPEQDKRTEEAVRTITSTELIQKRTRLGLTQKQAAIVSGIPYGSYIMAECYARMGYKVLPRVQAWLKRPDAADKKKIETITRRKKSNG